SFRQVHSSDDNAIAECGTVVCEQVNSLPFDFIKYSNCLLKCLANYSQRFSFRCLEIIYQTFDVFYLACVLIKSFYLGFLPMAFHRDNARCGRNPLRKFCDLKRGSITSQQLNNISLREHLLNGFSRRRAIRIDSLAHVAE